MKLTSPEFKSGGNIPSVYTCDGRNISPPLQISDAPEGTKSLALVVDDPDAPGRTFDHWIVWNIPQETTEIPEGKQPEGTPGENDFGDLTYGGPCPPSGTHTYRFKLYALDARLELGEGSSKEQLQQEMEGHVLADTLLEGNYSRQ